MDHEIVTHRTIYSRDTAGKVRIWYAQSQGGMIRNVSGAEGAKLVESGWKQMEVKNAGKRNEKSAEAQALIEIDALYTKQLKKNGYWETREEIDNEAKYLAPMLALKLHEDVEITDPTEVWFEEAKLDGFRCIATGEQAMSRHGEKFFTVGHITEKLGDLLAGRKEILSFDGELYNHRYHDNFNKISSLLTKKSPNLEQLNEAFDLVEYHIYDFVPAPGFENIPFIDRKAILQYILPKDDQHLIGTTVTKLEGFTTAADLLAEIEHRRKGHVKKFYEGQMLKRATGLYQLDTRSENMIKNKVFVDEEFKIKRFVEGKGNGKGLAKSAEFENAAGEEFSAGINGGNAFTKDLWENREKYEGIAWATVKFINLTPGKLVPRHGKVTKIYDGERKY